MQLKSFNPSRKYQRITLGWLCCFALLPFSFAAPKTEGLIQKSIYDSFGKFDSERWEIEGQAEINYGLAVFKDPKKSIIRLKNTARGEDWKVQFLVKFGLNAGEFSLDLMQKGAKAPLVSSVMKWLENDGEGEVNVAINNSTSGQPQSETMILQAIATEKWQIVELEKRAHKMTLKIHHQKINEFIWKGEAFISMSGVTSGEIQLDDFIYRPMNHDYDILDSVSIPGYGEDIPGWKSLSGTWGSIFLPRSHQKVIAQTSKENGILYFEETQGNDFELKVDCRLEQGKMIGLGLIDPETNELYRLVMESENSVGLRFEHVVKDKVELLSRSEKTIFPGVWNQVSMNLWNGHCDIAFDGQKVFDHIKVPYGFKPCLITSGTQTALFRNLILKEERVSLSSVKFRGLGDESVLTPGDWQPDLKAVLKKTNQQPAEMLMEVMNRLGDCRMLAKFKMGKDNAHVIFEFTSGLNRAELHFVKQQSKWFVVKLVKEKGDLKEVPVNSEMQKILFSNMNQDLFIVELKELISTDLSNEHDLLITRGSSHGNHGITLFLNSQELGRLSMKSTGSLKCRLLSFGTTELSELTFKVLNRDYQAWLKDPNPASGLLSNSGLLTLTGGTFDDRSLKEGKFLAFSEFLKEGGEFHLDIAARGGQGKVGFFLEDLNSETYALGSLSLAENDASVWINTHEETKGIEKKDGKQQFLRIQRLQQKAIIYYGEKLLGSVPLYTSIPMRVYVTRLSGAFQLNAYRFQNRIVENSIEFTNTEWLKTQCLPLKFNFDLDARLKSTSDWKGFFLYAAEGEGNGFELKQELPNRFVLNFDSDYRSIKNLDFEHEIKLSGESGEISIKILQLEKGVELLFSIGGEVKFRKAYLSKLINYCLIQDGKKFGIYTNGFLIGEEKLLSENPWNFETKVRSLGSSSLKMTKLRWSDY